MRVLVVPKDFPTAAHPEAGIFILRRLQAMQALGHDVSVLRIAPRAPAFGAKWTAYRSIPEHDLVEGIPVHTVRAVIPPRMAAMEYVPLLLRRALEREIRSVGADLVHASFLLPCGHLAVRQRLVPSIVTAHGVDAYKWPFQRPGLRKASREAVTKATAVTAVSGYIARCLQSFAPREVRVIWNGADEHVFYPRDRAASRALLGLPADRRIALFVGNALRAKGLFDLVEALASIPHALRPLLAVAGAGADLDAVRNLAMGSGVEARFLGRVAHAEVPDLFGAADVVVLPSHNEGLPNVVCEAMLSERAVVATTVGGIPEIIESERSGLLVAPRDTSALANALRRASNDEPLRDRLASGARRFALQHLTWPKSAREYERVYEEALGMRERFPAGIA